MGTASTHGDAKLGRQTRCTTCRTVVEVSSELLSSSDTRVRCGECLSIFDARANLRDADADEGDVVVKRTSASAGVTVTGLDDDADGLHITHTDFDLFSGNARLPEVAYLDETADTPEFDFDTIDFEEDERFGKVLFVDDEKAASSSVIGRALAGVEASGGGLDRLNPDERSGRGRRDGVDGPDLAAVDAARAVDAGRDDASAAAPALGHRGVDTDAVSAAALADIPATSVSRSGGSWTLRALVVSGLGALLVGLYLARGWGSLHNDPLVRPLLVAVCRVGGCTVPSRVDLASLTLLDKSVFTHPNAVSALVVNVAFRNAATFDQRYPVLVVRLRDRVGRSVAERDFAPADYVESWRAGDTIAAGRRLDIRLEVDDPGDGADSYEFEFREASG